jgi:Acyl-protein synthetase, LuxE
VLTDELLALPQYSLARAEKDAILAQGLSELTEHHRARCREYARVLSAFHGEGVRIARPADAPWLPVNLFKTHRLRSIPEDEVFKVLTSSGTTSQAVSHIFLDSASAARQTRALASVMTHTLGTARLPMIIVDSRSVIRDRRSFSARGAGVLGMATFGRSHFYALDNEMRLDRDGLRRFLAKHAGERLLIFGFTYMVWQYLLQELAPGEADLSAATLIHSGGWKKLEQASVDNAEFKRRWHERTGLERSFNFYGMVEQIGTVFLECEHGLLHAPNFAEVIVRDPVSWREAPREATGVIQLVSLLPSSYPGHSILSEDLGRVVAHDDCACGRRGKGIVLAGRIPKAELRGCSDTHTPAESALAA